VARVNGKPGRWAKDRAERQLDLLLLLYGVLLALGGICFGFILAKGWSASALLALLILSLLLVSTGRPMHRLATTIGKQRLKFWRGAQVEALVGWLLQDLDDQCVFNGIQLQEASDIDHVVVGPGGLYCVSTKSARGLFSLAPDGRVFYNNKPTGLIGNTQSQAMALRERLRGLLGADVPYVNAVLAVPLANVDFSGPQQNVWVLHQHDLLTTITNAPKRLDWAEVERIAKALEMLLQSGKTIYKADDRHHGRG